jgi:hypothetical protein
MNGIAKIKGASISHPVVEVAGEDRRALHGAQSARERDEMEARHFGGVGLIDEVIVKRLFASRRDQSDIDVVLREGDTRGQRVHLAGPTPGPFFRVKVEQAHISMMPWFRRRLRRAPGPATLR